MALFHNRKSPKEGRAETGVAAARFSLTIPSQYCRSVLTYIHVQDLPPGMDWLSNDADEVVVLHTPTGAIVLEHQRGRLFGEVDVFLCVEGHDYEDRGVWGHETETWRRMHSYIERGRRRENSKRPRSSIISA